MDDSRQVYNCVYHYMDFDQQEYAWASQEELYVCLGGCAKPAWASQEELDFYVGGCKACLSQLGRAELLCRGVLCASVSREELDYCGVGGCGKVKVKSSKVYTN